MIGVLAGSLILLIDPVKQLQRSRDGRRKADLKQIQTGLELYRSDVGKYPTTSGSIGSSLKNLAGDVTYIQTVPQDPKYSNAYYYEPDVTGNKYTIYACAENASSTDLDAQTTLKPSPSLPSCPRYFKYSNP